MLVKTYGSTIVGINAITIITIEVNIDIDIAFFFVGLPDNAVKETHQRIEAALQNNGFKIPQKKTTMNMTPANIRKEGG
jgi:magnesium chelatase family protein